VSTLAFLAVEQADINSVLNKTIKRFFMALLNFIINS
jgi:hypothetical protein